LLNNNDKIINIGDRSVGQAEPCFIIAEAGSNHDRDIDQALGLIDVAAEAGADAVKFQVFSADKIAADTKSSIASLDQDKFGSYAKSLYELYKTMELPPDWLPKLKKHADKCGIMFAATPFDEEAVDQLNELNVPFFKIASFEIVHLPLIRYVASKGKPLILSTGMATMEEIDEAVEAVKKEHNDQYALLHCGIEYPPKMEDIHLAAMEAMRGRFACTIGYSDHTLGVTVPVAAVARGATIIEKHFTLDKALPGPDHSFALSPTELKSMVVAIRDVEKAIGRSEKQPVEREQIYLSRGRRSLFAKVDIEAGTVITKEMISILRPGIGLMPKYLDRVIGKKARSRIVQAEPITWETISE